MKPGNLMKIKVPNPAAIRKMRIRFVTHIESVDVCFCIYTKSLKGNGTWKKDSLLLNV